MNKLGVSVFRSAILASLIILVSCVDAGDPPEEGPVEASVTSVSLAPGQSTVVQISGGRPPYGITAAPADTVAIATLGDATRIPVDLAITALASTTPGFITSVSVGDADELGGGGAFGKVAHGENEVEISIIIAAGGVSLANDLQPIFDASCATSGCHAGATPQIGLSLESGLAYSKLVNVPAGAPDCNGNPRVSPGNSANSVLYKRVSGTACGVRMPWSLIPGSDTLTTAEQTAIRDWIDQGALNN